MRRAISSRELRVISVPRTEVRERARVRRTYKNKHRTRRATVLRAEHFIGGNCFIWFDMTVRYIVTLFFLSVASRSSKHSPRDKRSLLELAGVIKCSTGRPAMSYMMYGCYCGLGGQGWPRDKADWCCHKHDCCYVRAEELGCHAKTEKYSWSCSSQSLDCGSLTDHCEKMLCTCDTEAAQCLKRAPYTLGYAVWPDFLCGAEHPTCAYY